ncbi:flagellin N-terminal helical domain-containing protein [Kineococcus terrestris]|uniref:flagellin N-terminal helical domain-containing protein n=1 Tax=Kineococcus terrestris TaxID=2044856 RepID=UPI0034DAF000
MGLRVNNNIASFNAWRNLQTTDKALNNSLEKLSSGLRINKAADDAAGLVVSENLRAQVGGLTVAARNAQDGVNIAQIADGALGTVGNILNRMRDLAVQAANGSADDDAKQAAQDEFEELAKQIDDIGDQTKFSSKEVFSTGAFTIHVGANSGESIDLSVGELDSANIGSAGDISTVDLTSDADGAIDTIQTAIENLSSKRATIGAVQNRFEHVISNLNVSIENLTASSSAIRDTDMAAEMTRFTRSQILSQAGTSMLAQANSASQNVLALLRG